MLNLIKIKFKDYVLPYDIKDSRLHRIKNKLYNMKRKFK
jgi:hypothetical protein